MVASSAAARRRGQASPARCAGAVAVTGRAPAGDSSRRVAITGPACGRGPWPAGWPPPPPRRPAGPSLPAGYGLRGGGPAAPDLVLLGGQPCRAGAGVGELRAARGGGGGGVGHAGRGG